MARAPRLDGVQEHFTEQQAAELTQAARAAVARWHDKRAGTARAFVDVCARVAAFTDAKVKPTKDQDKAFWKALGDPSNFTRSAWRTIGEHAEALAPHAAHLPTAQEAIKELARAEKKERGAIDKLMSSGLNENSSVGDVRKAVRPYVGGTGEEPTSDEHMALLRATRVEQVVTIIKQALTANDAINISFTDDKVLADKVISALGKWTHDTGNAKRLVIDGGFPHNPIVSFETSGKMNRLQRLSDEYHARLWDAEQKAARKAIEKHYRSLRKRESAALAKVYRGLAALSKKQFTAELNRRIGWSLDDIDFTAGSVKEWLASVNEWRHTLDAKSVSAAVDKATARVKAPKALAELQAEYDDLLARSPKQVVASEMPVRSLGEPKGKITF